MSLDNRVIGFDATFNTNAQFEPKMYCTDLSYEADVTSNEVTFECTMSMQNLGFTFNEHGIAIRSDYYEHGDNT